MQSPIEIPYSAIKIIRAEHLGMCFGVRDAIAFAEQQVESKPLTILGELVHNETVLDGLRAKGVQFANRLSAVGTSTVMITAHGTSERTLSTVREQGHQVLEATCPLVHYAHRSLRKLVEAGYHAVIIGKPEHVEVRGMTDDLTEFDVVLNADGIACMKERARFGVISQTTQPIEKVRHLVGLLRQRFPKSEVRFIDTVCQPTKQRQSSAIALAKKCEVVLVIGGAHSNNTKELVTTCEQFCERVHHVQIATDLQPDWFRNVEIVGITAGTSTPDATICEIETRLLQLSREESFRE